MCAYGRRMIRGVLHVHSNVSPDSTLPLEYIQRFFKARGHSFVLLTEHAEDLTPTSYAEFTQRCAALSDDAFVMVPGLEIKWKDRAHLLAYGAREYCGNEDMLSLADTITRIR